MDETLAVVALDLGGRPALVYKDLVRVRLVGDLQTELVEDFFGGFVNHAGANLHARVLYGRSNHHKIEAIFKCFARALKYACSTDRRLKDQVPSTKGLLSRNKTCSQFSLSSLGWGRRFACPDSKKEEESQSAAPPCHDRNLRLRRRQSAVRGRDRLDRPASAHDTQLVGQDCILQPIFNRLPAQAAIHGRPMQSACRMQSCPTVTMIAIFDYG